MRKKPILPQKTNFKVLIVLCALFIHIQGISQIVYEDLYTTTTFDAVTIDTSLPVGATAGSSDVVNGTSSYIIPIQIPAGTNGVTPDITVAYNSQGGDGHLGLGWGLTGISTISRGLKTIYHDEESGPIKLDGNDVFLIDGMRMIDTSAGVYVKEMNDYSTIEEVGSFGSGPASFKMETKYGVVFEYGKENNSALKSEDGTEIMVWKVSKIIYKDGNYIEFFYTDNNRDLRITEIKYTGNTVANLAPYNSIKFNYEDRGEFSNTVYEAEQEVKLKYLLDNIEIRTEGNELVKKYAFTYAHDDINVFLKKITESGSDGSELNPTIFKYGEKPADYSYEYLGFDFSYNNQLVTGDYTGDGFTDMMVAKIEEVDGNNYHTEISVYKKAATNNNNFFLKFTHDLPENGEVGENVNAYNFYSSDFSGEGRDDIAYSFSVAYPPYFRELDKVELYIMDEDAESFSTISIDPPPTYIYYDPAHRHFLTGDFNGDGISDIIVILGADPIGDHQQITLHKAFVYYGNISTGFELISLTGSYTWGTENWNVEDINVLDINGDGKSDLMITDGNFSEIFEMDGVFCRSLTGGLMGYPTEWHLMFFGDFNGDRKTDMLTRGGTTGPWNIGYSTGKGFVEEPFTWISNPPDINEYYEGDLIIVGDNNGDGKSDITRGVNFANDLFIQTYYSKGDEWEYTAASIDAEAQLNVNGTHDFNGDGRSEVINRTSDTSPSWVLKLKPNGKELMLKEVKNGHGHRTRFTYNKMNVGNYCERTDFTAHPVNTLRLPMYLVTNMWREGNKSTNYEYSNAKLHKEGKGFLGFEKITKWSIDPHMYEDTYYELNMDNYSMMPSSIVNRLQQTILNTRTIENTYTNTLGFNGAVSHYTHHITGTTDVNDFEGYTTTTNTVFDEYGNATSSSSDVGGIVNTQTTTVYEQHGTPIPASPVSIISTVTRAGSIPFVTEDSLSYNTLGQVVSKTSFPNTDKSITETYGYNDLGNIVNTTISAPNEEDRTSTTTYDPKGRHIVSAINTIGQSSTATYDSKWSKPLNTTGIDGLSMSYEYDAFGRLAKTTVPQGYDIDETYDWESGTAVYSHSMIHPNKGNVKSYYDKVDRVTQLDQVGFSTTKTSTTTYDNRGNVESTTTPTGFTTTTSYDDYNRPISIVDDFGTTSITYTYTNGELKTQTTNAAGQISSQITDASKKVIEAEDYGGMLRYEYHSQGDVKQVEQGFFSKVAGSRSSSVVLTTEIDAYGRQTELDDVNAGITTYEYDAFGQLVNETTANNQTTTMSYDKLGRLTERIGVEGVTAYQYYPTGSGASTNLLQTITSFGGDIESYSYDGFGRLNSFTHNIDGEDYTFSYSHDIYDNVLTKTYPSGFILDYDYDINGYLTTIKNQSGTKTYFSLLEMNSLDQPTRYLSNSPNRITDIDETHGIITNSSVANMGDIDNTWNFASGNLTSRERTFKTESFGYDNLNRLTDYQVASDPTLLTNYTANGNITNKTDVGGSYLYESDKVNAITGVTNPDYDNLSIYTQQISYTPFMQPHMITERDNKLTFSYGSDHQRIKTVQNNSNGGTVSRYYFGDYEKIDSSGEVHHVHYITIGHGINQIVVRKDGVDENYNVLTDHLGSIWAVLYETEDIINLNFDPWGRRRNPTDWSYDNIPNYPIWLNRGFTGHEHLDSFQLINMNGRLYDPVLGRMLSPDNNIQLPNYTQNYNRYSYALNNPLRYTDPDGEFIVPILVGAAIGVVTNGINNSIHHQSFFDGAGKAAIFGAIGGGLSAGIGLGATQLASNGIDKFGIATFQAIAHGTTGAMMSIAQGGNPLHGFSSGGISSVVGSGSALLGGGATTIIISGGISGGIGAKIAGGDFMDGLRQGLITAGLNHVAHRIADGIETKIVDKKGRLLLDIDDGSDEIFAIEGIGDFIKELSCLDYCDVGTVHKLAEKFSLKNTSPYYAFIDGSPNSSAYRSGFHRAFNSTVDNLPSIFTGFEKGGGTYYFGYQQGTQDWKNGYINVFQPTVTNNVPVFSNDIYKNYNIFNIYKY